VPAGSLRGNVLLDGVREDRRAGTGRVVRGPEDLEQVVVGDLPGVVVELDRPVRRLDGADTRGVDTRDRVERGLDGVDREGRLLHPGIVYTGRMPTREEVFEALKVVEDPELGMDIVDLGLVYDAEVEGARVKVVHSLTSMGCPVGPMIQADIRTAVEHMDGVEDVEIELTWDPPWTPDRMSDDAKFILGFG
jgi:metal-sulfur cluster biosynthetic enzyme